MNGFVKNKFDIRQEKYIYENSVENMTYESASCIDEFTPPITDQHKDGSCTVHNWLSLVEYCLLRIDRKYFSGVVTPENIYSRRGMWYLTKDVFGFNPSRNIGVSHGAISKVGAKKGIMYVSDYPESTPRDIAPSYQAMMKMNSAIKAYYKITTKEGVVDALTRKLPVMFGYDSSIAKACRDTGYLPSGFNWNQDFEADHSNGIWAYDSDTDLITIRNSWGKDFGDNGYFYVPLDKMFPLMEDITVVICKDEEFDADSNYWDKASLEHNLPKDIIIFGNQAKDVSWANDPQNRQEVRKLMADNNGKIFMVDSDGVLQSNKKLKIDDMVLFNEIGKYVYYNGQKINIFS